MRNSNLPVQNIGPQPGQESFGDKPPGFPLILQWKPRFWVCPGDNPATKGGRKSLCVKSLGAFSLASKDLRSTRYFQRSRCGLCGTFRKFPAPIKIKSAPPPPSQKPKFPPPPENKEFYGHGGFPAERKQKLQAPIKLTHPFPAPELRTNILRT